MFLRFCGTRCREKRGDESKNYSPPIPPTRIPFLLTPDHFYVRFPDFSVFHFCTAFSVFWTPLDPIGTHWKCQAKGQGDHYKQWNRGKGQAKCAGHGARGRNHQSCPVKAMGHGAGWGVNRGPMGRKTEKLDFQPKNNILLHMAIQAVLAWQDGAETYSASK